jgi:hypothetical protein
MTLKRLKPLLRIVAVLGAVLLLLAAGAALAQQTLPATEGGDRSLETSSSGQPDGAALEIAAAAVAASAGTETGVATDAANSAGEPDGIAQTGDEPDKGTTGTETGESPEFTSQQGYVDGQAPDDNAGLAPSAVDATFSYYTVAGPELQPRTTSNTQVYSGNGCVYMSTGAGTGLLTGTGLHIPAGSIIKFIRLYYNDTNAAAGVDAFLTRYAPGSATADLISTGSANTFSGGYGFVVSAEITQTVNNTAYAYILYGWPDSNLSNLQVCGIRVAYYAPTWTNLFLPAIRR